MRHLRPPRDAAVLQGRTTHLIIAVADANSVGVGFDRKLEELCDSYQSSAGTQHISVFQKVNKNFTVAVSAQSRILACTAKLVGAGTSAVRTRTSSRRRYPALAVANLSTNPKTSRAMISPCSLQGSVRPRIMPSLMQSTAAQWQSVPRPSGRI